MNRKEPAIRKENSKRPASRVRRYVLAACLVAAVIGAISYSCARMEDNNIPESERKKAEEVAGIAEPMIRELLEERYGFSKKDYRIKSVKPQFRRFLGVGPFFNGKTKYYEGYLAIFKVNGKEYAAYFDPAKGKDQPFLCNYQTEQLSRDIGEYLMENVFVGEPVSVAVYAGHRYEVPGSSKIYYFIDMYYDGKELVPSIQPHDSLFIIVQVYYVNSGFSFEETYEKLLPGPIAERFSSLYLLRIVFYDHKSKEAIELSRFASRGNYPVDSKVDWRKTQEFTWDSFERIDATHYYHYYDLFKVAITRLPADPREGVVIK